MTTVSFHQQSAANSVVSHVNTSLQAMTANDQHSLEQLFLFLCLKALGRWIVMFTLTFVWAR